MTEHIIKPKYTSKDICDIYYGTNSKKRENFSNPAYTKWFLLEFVLLCFYIIYMIIFIKTGWLFAYMKYLNVSVTKFLHLEMLIKANGAELLFNIFVFVFTIIGCFYLLLFPVFLLPFKIIGHILKKAKEKCISQGLIYKSPVSSKEYNYFKFIYEEAERALKVLESGNNVDKIIVKNEDSICIYEKNNLILTEKKYKFTNLAKKIFTPDKIDFSVIDAEWEKILTVEGESSSDRS